MYCPGCKLWVVNASSEAADLPDKAGRAVLHNNPFSSNQEQAFAQVAEGPLGDYSLTADEETAQEPLPGTHDQPQAEQLEGKLKTDSAPVHVRSTPPPAMAASSAALKAQGNAEEQAVIVAARSAVLAKLQEVLAF